jgi:hypothetical protein
VVITLHPDLCTVLSAGFLNAHSIVLFNLQLGVLNSQATSRRASTVDKNPLIALALTREWQAEFLVERQAHSDDANASRCSLLEGKTIRDLVRGTLSDHSVFCKAAAVQVRCIGSVCHAGNAVAGFEALDTVGSCFDNGATEVTSDGRARSRQVVDVFPRLLSVHVQFLPAEHISRSPVSRVECNGVDFDEDTITLQFWLRDILNLGLAG